MRFSPRLAYEVNEAQLPSLRYIDGRRTIREIAARVAQNKTRSGVSRDFEKFGRKLFRQDFIVMTLNPHSRLSQPITVGKSTAGLTGRRAGQECQHYWINIIE
jgi:hypothetical protein